MADDDQGQIIDDQNQVPETIRIGEEEFSLEEAQRLVSLGKIGVEAEEKYNTKLDRVWPDYTKTKNEFRELQDQMQNSPAQPEPQADPNDEIEKARSVLKNMGFLTQEQVDNHYKNLREGEKLLERTQSLEGKYDGSDGRPKASTEDLLIYMKETGIKDPEVAYKVKFENELDEWRSGQIGKKKPGMTTETKVVTDKQPVTVRPNPDNLAQMISEALGTRE